jgi:probable phosphoglycerate mutase
MIDPALSSRRASPSQTSSVPRHTDWIFAHCDGGSRGNPGPAGFGVLVQSASGEVLAELSEFLGIRTNNYAEYAGLLASLDYALAKRHPRLRVTSDSELMVKQIQGKYKVKSPDLRPLFEQAKRKIDQLDAFEIVHALRHKNQDADRLANQAMDQGTNRGLYREPTESAPSVRPTPLSKQLPPKPAPKTEAQSGMMLRGFVKGGAVHVLGNHTLPEGAFVKVIPE